MTHIDQATGTLPACRYDHDGPWVYDQCGQGHHWHEEGEGITWRRCCRCSAIEHTPAHRAEVAAEQAEQERAG